MRTYLECIPRFLQQTIEACKMTGLSDDKTKAIIDKIATVISNGSDASGTILASCFREFRDIWNKCDLVIGKGQGNFESLSEAPGNIFFMFIVKCRVLARDIGCNIRDVILCRNRILHSP